MSPDAAHLPPSRILRTSNGTGGRQPTPVVFFDRRELGLLLSLYGRMVAAGQWRDYAIEGRASVAVFAVFRHAHETPLYRIEKHPTLAPRQGAWLITARGVALRRGHELAQVLRVFDRARLRVVT